MWCLLRKRQSFRSPSSSQPAHAEVFPNQWFHLQWPAGLQALSIAVKELIPVVIAATLFGHQWKSHLIKMVVDNMSVVHVLNLTYSKDPHLMHLIRILVFMAAHFDFWFQAQHVEGKSNHLADGSFRVKSTRNFGSPLGF